MPQNKNILETKFIDLESQMTTYMKNALRRFALTILHIDYSRLKIKHLIGVTKTDLKRLQNVGSKTAFDLAEFLQLYNLKIGD